MFDSIFSVFGHVEGETVVLIILAGLVLLLLLSITGVISRQATPGLMTSLGIFGTFWGVFIALHPLDFSPSKMNDSIASLLQGMTTAFLTSLLGLGFGIVMKFWWSRSASAQKSRSPEHKDIVGQLDAIRKAISGEDDSSMVTQMQKLRDENRDGFKKLDGLAKTIQDALVKNLENLIKEIREIIGKQLGESLKKLIENIEEALIKQFGATFVQFNEAVQALKKWQEDHREQVEQLTTVFKEVATGIEKIKDDCAKIPLMMDDLGKIVEKTKEQLDELSERVEAFAEMKQQAVESFPMIKANLDKIGEDLKNSAEGFQGLETTIKSVFETSEREARVLTENMRSAMEQAQRDTAQQVEAVITQAAQQFSTNINNEIDRLTREWGNNMVSIAERCQETILEVNANKNNR